MIRTATVVACAAVALALAAPAHAEPAGSDMYVLQVFGAVERHEDTAISWHRATTLACDPAGGGHARAQEACDLIAEHGDIASVTSVGDGFCTMEYRPVTVRVSGAEEYEETFGNQCVMNSAKGAVFDF
ncbi:MAG: subtilisin inhibitor-like 2 domain protein [Nocardiopsis sp. BM-2018]|nr:MAG: subtilisin inhibitor-like 2 domain protein [Nocardiopsis sp. BM-2018]